MIQDEGYGRASNPQEAVNSMEENSSENLDLAFDEDLVIIDIDLQTREEVIKLLSEKFIQKGYVTDKFTEAVLDRERKFPTGLPTVVPIALPHTDAIYCKKSAIAVGILKTPISFKEMGNPDKSLLVKIVFLLALPNPDLQTKWLQRLVEVFKDGEILKRLAGMRTKQEIFEFLNKALFKSKEVS
jgi:PTS system galactitol-specific IIA component